LLCHCHAATHFFFFTQTTTMRLIAQGLLRQAKFGRNLSWKARQGLFSVAKIPGAEVASKDAQSLPTNQISNRTFSSESKTKLMDILAKECDEEVDSGNTEMPQVLSDLKANLEDEWRVVDDGANTQMFLKNKKVQISFHCQDAVEAVENEEEVNEEEEEEVVLPVHFTVTVSKAGKSLVLECLSDFGQAKVVGVQTSSSDVEDSNLYQGPDFVELDENVQEAFAVYLEEELSVGNDVAAFIVMYSDYKEQMQYVQFLKDVQAIVE
jgi:complement component 1 Q subcomponent-binding protein